MLSIIIPTKNEESYLPKLLESIKKQDLIEHEIIVADAGSKDRTREIAKKFGCRIIKGGKQSLGINNGVKAARYSTLLILDADAYLPKGFLKRNLSYFKKNQFDVASCYIRALDGNVLDDISHALSNIYYFLSKNIRPFIPSFCFFIRKDFFNKVGGFSHRIPWFIDLTFSNKLPKNTKNDMLPVPVYLSVRMATRLGRLRQAYTLGYVAILRLLKKDYYAEYKY